MGAQGLKGVEALTLEYKVGWPVSIILSRRALTKYQLLSRLLYFSKYVEVFGMRCLTVNFVE
jgi:gamma-tubulin complex component 2